MTVFSFSLDANGLWGVIVGFLAGITVVGIPWVVALRRLRQTQHRLEGLRDYTVTLERDHSVLQSMHEQRIQLMDQAQRDLEQTRSVLRLEFQQLAEQILQEKELSLRQTSQESLDALLTPFREQIAGFQHRVNQIHAETTRGQATLSAELRQVLEAGLSIGEQAHHLASALKGDKKAMGNWGEVLLERALELAGLVKGDHYQMQARQDTEQGQRRYLDFLIQLPEGKHLIIDSKVSLVDYERAVNAATQVERQQFLDAHVRAVKAHIDDLSGKHYADLPGLNSPGFVLMFMPVEPAYIEALRHDTQVYAYGYQRNVMLVSYTTLLPILKTVANVWGMARSQEHAHEISTRAGDIYHQIVLVADRLKKLGASLGTVNRHYNETVTAVAGKQGLYGKAARLGELSSRAAKSLPELAPLHADLETERLDMVLSDTESVKENTQVVKKNTQAQERMPVQENTQAQERMPVQENTPVQ